VYGRNANGNTVNKEILRSIESSIDESKRKRLGSMRTQFETVANKQWGVRGISAWVCNLDPEYYAELYELLSNVALKSDYGLAYQNTWTGMAMYF
jgi:hypothetical protein